MGHNQNQYNFDFILKSIVTDTFCDDLLKNKGEQAKLIRLLQFTLFNNKIDGFVVLTKKPNYNN